MFSSRGTVRYEERDQGYHEVEKFGKHWYKRFGRNLVNALIAVWRLAVVKPTARQPSRRFATHRRETAVEYLG